MYARRSRTITELKEAIREQIRAIPRSVCKDDFNKFVLRVKKCTELNGGHLEHMLYNKEEEANNYYYFLYDVLNKINKL